MIRRDSLLGKIIDYKDKDITPASYKEQFSFKKIL